MNVNHITQFLQKGTRHVNHIATRMRESVFIELNDDNSRFFKEPIYGPYWRSLKFGTDSLVTELLQRNKFPTDYSYYSLMKKGVSSEHAEFRIFVYTPSNTLLTNFDFELEINQEPRFLRLYDKDAYIKPTLTEFWYDSGLLKHEPYRSDHIRNNSTREEYLLKANDINMVCNHTEMNAFCDGLKVAQSRYLRNGISAYLKNYAHTFDIEKLRTNLTIRPINRVYAIWNSDSESFKVVEYTKEQVTPTRFLRIDNDRTVVLETQKGEMHLIPKWDSVPIWQIGIHKSLNKN